VSAAREPGKEPLRVSDHALVRWLGRTGLVDVEALRTSLSTALDRAYQAGATLEASEFMILSGGLVYLVREGTLVTVFNDAGRASQARTLTPRVED
jgi:hypothetical protein